MGDPRQAELFLIEPSAPSRGGPVLVVEATPEGNIKLTVEGMPGPKHGPGRGRKPRRGLGMGGAK